MGKVKEVKVIPVNCTKTLVEIFGELEKWQYGIFHKPYFCDGCRKGHEAGERYTRRPKKTEDGSNMYLVGILCPAQYNLLPETEKSE